MTLTRHVARMVAGLGWPEPEREHPLEEGLFDVPGWLPGRHYDFRGWLEGSAWVTRNVRAGRKLLALDWRVADRVANRGTR